MTYNQLTTEKFIERAKSIHGNIYDYSESVYSSMDRKIQIKCRKHGLFETWAGNHVNPKIKAGCPYCAKKLVYKGETDLQSRFPDIARYFDEYKNGVKADEIFARSNKKYWWKCDIGHSFQMRPLNRVRREKSCPYCSGQKLLTGFNDLQTIHPDIAAEWDYDKNEGSPSDYRYGSGYKAWWICKDCGESYQSPINIHTRGHKCPWCSGNKVIVGKTDLQTLFPDIAKEYTEDNELPEEISEEQYKYIREHKDEDEVLTGFVGFGCSFGGKDFGGYARNKTGTNYAKRSKKSLLKDMATLMDATFICKDYRDVELTDGCVVYADPPYNNTTGYGKEKFNSDEFWNYMREISNTHIVFISEQNAPDDFVSIWEKPFTRTLDVNKNNQFKVTEKLFIHKCNLEKYNLTK